MSLGHTELMADEFPSPTVARSSRTEVFLSYLDYFRSSIARRIERLGEDELRHSRLVSGWTPLELAKHLQYVELRWLEWGFLGVDVSDPWGDQREGRWYVKDTETRGELVAALLAQGETSRRIIEGNDLDASGRPSPRWGGEAPPTLERILFHLLQEYARHLGHLDIVVELSGGPVSE